MRASSRAELAIRIWCSKDCQRSAACLRGLEGSGARKTLFISKAFINTTMFHICFRQWMHPLRQSTSCSCVTGSPFCSRCAATGCQQAHGDIRLHRPLIV